MKIPLTPYRALGVRFFWMLTERGKARARARRLLGMELEDMIVELGLASPYDYKSTPDSCFGPGRHDNSTGRGGVLTGSERTKSPRETLDPPPPFP